MTSTSTRGRQLVLLAVLVGALAGGVAGATAGTGPDAGSVDTSDVVSPTVVVDDANVDADTTERVDVTLSSAPNGLAGYNLTLRVTDPGVATITDASVAERFGRSDATIVDGGSAVVLKAADTAGVVETDASDLALADVELTGQAVGSTEMTVEVTRIDDDRRGRVDPATDPGAVSVISGTTTTPATPTTITPTTTATPTTPTTTAAPPVVPTTVPTTATPTITTTTATPTITTTTATPTTTTTTATPTTTTPEPGDDRQTVSRFDGVGGPENGRIGSDEVLTGVAAYNANNTVGGEPVTTQDVLDLIAAFNQDDDDER